MATRHNPYDPAWLQTVMHSTKADTQWTEWDKKKSDGRIYQPSIPPISVSCCLFDDVHSLQSARSTKQRLVLEVDGTML